MCHPGYLNLLDFITHYFVVCKLWNISLCNLFQSCVTSTLAQISSSASYARMHLVYVLNIYSLISLRNEYVALTRMFLWDVGRHHWVTGAQCFETARWFHSHDTKCQKQ
jgi:hypothetical protein